MLRIALLIFMASSAAQAQDGDYIDDRSGPATVVHSLYNAINRREYARAWSYFAVPPAPDLDTYAEGYADTQMVEVLTGYANEEYAPDSTYYELPVAIRATSGDGSKTVFAGCYTLRLPDPGRKYTPLAIERGAMRRSDLPLEEALPRRCGDGPAPPEHDAVMEKARAAAFLKRCDTAGPDADAPESYDLTFRRAYEDDAAPERTARLFRFLCYRGAYNESHVYVLVDDEGEATLLYFAEPDLDIRYIEKGNDKLESVTVTGFITRPELVNSRFDPATQTIEEFTKWRGIGDASSSALWSFEHGQFRLVRYAVDPTYDEEYNQEIVVDFSGVP